MDLIVTVDNRFCFVSCDKNKIKFELQQKKNSFNRSIKNNKIK